MRLIVLLLIVLAGCTAQRTIWHSTTPEERAAHEAQQRKLAKEKQRQDQEAAERYVAGLRAECAGYGFTPNTNEFAGCVMRLHQMNVAAAQKAAAGDAAESAALLQYSQQMIQMGQPHVLGR